MPIIKKEFPTFQHELYFIASEIENLLKKGIKPSEIAVISRKHSSLREVVEIFNHFGIPVFYEKGENIFQKPHILEIINILKFLHTLVNFNQQVADEFLPEILSYPFWEIQREDVWKVSTSVWAKSIDKNEKKPVLWLQEMVESKNPKISLIANFFISLGVEVKNKNLEEILDIIVGTEKFKDYLCPYKNYYFKEVNADYLALLSNLKVLVKALREYKSKTVLSLGDFVEFVQLHEINNLELIDNSVFNKSENGVNLLTAHKAKGMEFETVFVFNLVQNEWASRGKASKLKFPSNLELMPENDDKDDQRRLLFVALTRAKDNLYLTNSLFDISGKNLEKVEFIEEEFEKMEFTPSQTANVLESFIVQPEILNLNYNEKELLKARLENYQLSVTHLTNFLDVTSGGPKYFLETNLLLFPKAKSPSGGYGSAMHEAIKELYREFTLKSQLPSLQFLQDKFKQILYYQRLDILNHKKFLAQGLEALELYYLAKKDSFNPQSKLEFSFKSQGVAIQNAHLTGQIDKMDLNENEIVVTDFKTGKTALNWNGKDEYEKIKLYKYQTQLVFYKILVENSKEFGGKYIVNKGLLEFLEPDKKTGEVVDLEKEITLDEVERLTKLISVVYQRIINLDFPDISKYEKNLRGIKQFEDDLIESI